MAAVRSTGQGQGGQNCKPVVAAGPQDRVGSHSSVSEVIESMHSTLEGCMEGADMTMESM